MKKIRFFILISCLMAILVLFNSCAGSIAVADSFGDVLNVDYMPQEENVENVVEIEELRGFSFIESAGEFMTFVKNDDAGMKKVVFSTRNKKVIYACESNESEAFEIKLMSGIPVFTVTRTQLSPCADNNCEFDSTCELYDATGTLVAQIKGTSPTPILFADTVIFNFGSYSINEENGTLTKIADVSENLYLSSCDDWNDKYFYTYDDTINVYDRNFTHVYSWTIPSWGEYISKNVLDDGKIIVQYTRPLDNNAEKYDIYELNTDSGVTVKYDIHTFLLDPEKKVEKEIKLEYIVEHVTTGTELIRTSANNGMYRDGVTNIAYIYPISEQQVDYSDASADIVLMDNNAKIKKSLKILDSQKAALPTCIGNNVYIISTVYGTSLIDIDGNIIHQMSNDTVHTVGENIVSDGMIYTLDMQEVYSLYDNGATVMTYLNGTVFLEKESDTEYSIIAIRGMQEKEILKYNTQDAQNVYFDEFSDIGCYSISNVEKGEYTYYNSKYETLYTSSVRLDKLASDFSSGFSLFSATVEDEIRYYAFY